MLERDSLLPETPRSTLPHEMPAALGDVLRQLGHLHIGALTLGRDAAIDHHSMGSTESAANRISSRVSTIVAGLGVISLAEVRLQEGESIENALRRFKRKVQTEDIIKEVKRHSFYLKPGAKRRVKEALARKRARKKVRKESD